MDKQVSSRSTKEKALRLNLDDKKYGTIVEIGAGQEVARNFFVAGAAAGTIAKTMSAYDMKFSDAIYGVQQNGRYVSKGRVLAMMEQEYDLVVERVADVRSRSSRYFSYAATVAAKSFNRDNECHAWCGVRVQMYPGAEPSNIVVHVRMFDDNAEDQQQALGILGVNLIYGSYYYFEDPKNYKVKQEWIDELDKCAAREVYVGALVDDFTSYSVSSSFQISNFNPPPSLLSFSIHLAKQGSSNPNSFKANACS